MFASTGVHSHNLTELAGAARTRRLPAGKLWARPFPSPSSSAGPLLALGLLTRLVALAIVIFLLVTNVERWRVGKYFWNQRGLEYTLMWTVAAIYFLIRGGRQRSLSTTSSAARSSL